ncbi:glycoside hydrolase family 16 protein [Marasmius fiardii PR-910]|nr:glycoside hydrolase family 16 protein [Marasmius fiardii PR-910]
MRPSLHRTTTCSRHMRYDFTLFFSLLILDSSANALNFLKLFQHGELKLASPAQSFSRRATLANPYDQNPNGSVFVWLPEDEYSGQKFFDAFAFFTGDDPTHGRVDYIDANYAFQNGLAYVQDDGVVIMKGDNTSWLQDGEYRKSVRISSYKQYNTGLFILDINKAPWGCAVWPAFWTLGGGHWPDTGEIDIIEGVHDNQHNQVAWHTAPGCHLNPNSSFTGTVVVGKDGNNTNCDGNINDNAGCGVTEWSRASYGPLFDQQGGGVFAMKWDENGIAIWSFFRAAVPQDIVANTPNPSLWGRPSASLDPALCDPIAFFKNHSIIFDITFCGDWAGNSYATSGCPGTCQDRLKDPNNFVNATWSINHLRVYRKQVLNGRVSATATSHFASLNSHWCWAVLAILLGTLAGL